ncbi:MAG: hypothetical protein V4443_03675 [Pseudomonadota bacterium]
MKIYNFFSRIPPRYWGYLILLLWSYIVLLLVRHDAFNLDEGATKALLLAWAIADNLAISVVTFGTPDLRTVLFIPIGILEPGSVFAAKVFTVLSFAATVGLLYCWRRRSVDTECALIGTSLLLVAPLTLQQIDTLSPGTYLLLAFALGAWLNQAYRAAPHTGGGWYFAQLFICAVSISLHPAGLAYPLALLWSWYKDPLDSRQQKYYFIGVSFVMLLSLFTMYIGNGWHDLEWKQNPIINLSTIVLGSSINNEASTIRWVAGSLILIWLIIVLVKQLGNLWTDFTGRTLLFGLVIGAATSDKAWCMMVLCIILYFGLPLLLNRPATQGGFFRQRGVVLILVVILFTLFTRADKTHYEIRQMGILSEQDQLIKTLAEEAEIARKAYAEDEALGLIEPADKTQHQVEDVEAGIIKEPDSKKIAALNPNHLRIASQWPGRTMIACRCDTLPLPPAAKDPQTQLAIMRGITHLIFDPQQIQNEALTRNLAMLNSSIETIALQPGGVLLHIRNTNSNTGNE